MKNFFTLSALFLTVPAAHAETNAPLSIQNYKDPANKLIKAATENDKTFQRLAYFCDTVGPRFTGTTNLERSIDWILAEMKKDGLENVRGDEVVVPHWVRGNESLELLEPHARKLTLLGLGGSIATPPEGVTAE